MEGGCISWDLNAGRGYFLDSGWKTGVFSGPEWREYVLLGP